MAVAPPSQAESDVGSRVSEVVRRLRATLEQLLAELPGIPARPLQLADLLKLKKDVPSRLLKALRTGDPIAAAHAMPGPAALRSVLTAAARHGASAAAVSQARAAVEGFERLIQQVAGDRGTFDTLISAWLPETRARVELLAKQAAYKGIVGLKGATADLKLSTAILYPSSDGRHLDVLWLVGAFGLRRMRPGAVVRFATRHLNTPTRVVASTLRGEPIMDAAGVTLEQFLSPPVGRLEVQREQDDLVHYVLAGDSLGKGAGVNVLMSELGRACLERYRPDPAIPRRHGPFAEVNLPLAALVFDVLVHHDVYPDQQPALVIFDTAINGIASINDPRRAIDRLDHNESIQAVGDGISKLRLAEYSNYLPLLEHACHTLSWDPLALRAYRCRITCPLYGAQIFMAFDAPPG